MNDRLLESRALIPILLMKRHSRIFLMTNLVLLHHKAKLVYHRMSLTHIILLRFIMFPFVMKAPTMTLLRKCDRLRHFFLLLFLATLGINLVFAQTNGEPHQPSSAPCQIEPV